MKQGARGCRENGCCSPCFVPISKHNAEEVYGRCVVVSEMEGLDRLMQRAWRHFAERPQRQSKVRSLNS